MGRADDTAAGKVIDVSRTADEAGFSCPVVMTKDAWGELVAWDQEVPVQDLGGRLMDVLWCASRAVFGQERSEGPTECEVLRIPNRPGATIPERATFAVTLESDEEGVYVAVSLP